MGILSLIRMYVFLSVSSVSSLPTVQPHSCLILVISTRNTQVGFKVLFGSFDQWQKMTNSVRHALYTFCKKEKMNLVQKRTIRLTIIITQCESSWL
jgi:hypothetical protein